MSGGKEVINDLQVLLARVCVSENERRGWR